MKEKIGWGILGPGSIAHHFVKDLQLVAAARLTAVASRNLPKAIAFKEQYNFDHAFGSYEEMFASKEVDVVYIATPHTAHLEWAIKAMEAGKHVLCEKPLGVNTAEVQRMISAAKINKVFLMEALWSRFNPTIQKIKQLIDQGTIGDVAHVHADFGFNAMDRSEDSRLLNPALAGGSLLDIGIYPIFLAYFILGKPDHILATSNFHSTGVEIQSSIIFKYPTAQALLYSGLKTKTAMKAEISGSKGTLFLEPRWHETQGYYLAADDKEEHCKLPTTGKGYTHEIAEVHACLKNGKLESTQWSHEHSLDLIGLIDTVRKQSKVQFPFES